MKLHHVPITAGIIRLMLVLLHNFNNAFHVTGSEKTQTHNGIFGYSTYDTVQYFENIKFGIFFCFSGWHPEYFHFLSHSFPQILKVMPSAIGCSATDKKVLP